MGEEMENQFDDLEKDLRDINQTYETMMRDAAELVELQHVLENTATMFTDAPKAREALDEENARSPLLGDL